MEFFLFNKIKAYKNVVSSKTNLLMLFYFSYIECQHFVILLSFFSHSAFTFLSEEWRKNALLSAFCIDRLESQQFSFFLS